MKCAVRRSKLLLLRIRLNTNCPGITQIPHWCQQGSFVCSRFANCFATGCGCHHGRRDSRQRHGFNGSPGRGYWSFGYEYLPRLFHQFGFNQPISLIKDNPLFLNFHSPDSSSALGSSLRWENKRSLYALVLPRKRADRKDFSDSARATASSAGSQLPTLQTSTLRPNILLVMSAVFALREYLVLNDSLQQSILKRLDDFTPQSLETYLCQQHQLVTHCSKLEFWLF